MAELLWHAATDGGALSGAVQVSPRCGAVHITADLPAGILQNAAADLPWGITADERIFMNGYQTWTECAELRLRDKQRNAADLPKALLDKYGFDRYGDYHFIRYGKRAGQSHGFSYCYFRRGEHYRLIGTLNEIPGYTVFYYDSRAGQLHIERDCAGVQHGGGAYPLFDLFFAEGTEAQVFDAWFAALDCRPRTSKKLAGYSSWYNRYQNIDEASILEDLNGCKTLFQPGDLFQIDDGWEPKVGDWLETDAAKFPHGLRPLADAAHKSGFLAGLWLAPFVAEADSALYREHPDWFLQVDGAPWRCGGNWSGFYALDIDHPQVQSYLKQTFDLVLNVWGFDLVKLDFLYGAAPFGTGQETRAARMRRAMAMLREWCGDKLILGCGVPLVPSFGLVDYCRIGCDVGLDWDDVWYMRLFHRERVSTRQSIGNTLARRQLIGRAFGSDPDVFFLREENCKLSPAQKELLATANALFSGILLTSDMPSRYTEEARRQYAHIQDIFRNSENIRVRQTGNTYTVTYTLHEQEHCLIVPGR